MNANNQNELNHFLRLANMARRDGLHGLADYYTEKAIQLGAAPKDTPKAKTARSHK